MWGKLTARQEEVLRPFVEGKEVWDMGAGNCELSHRLLLLGAREVHAVDIRPCTIPSTVYSKLISNPAFTYHEMSIYEASIPEGAVAFVSWPEQYAYGLEECLDPVECVAYLGLNFNGTACGDERFWELMTQREYLAYAPERGMNSLIVYGGKARQRPLLPEELAAMDPNEIHWQR